MELEALLEGEEMSVRVHFVDGRSTHTLTNSWTTVQDVVDQVM